MTRGQCKSILGKSATQKSTKFHCLVDNQWDLISWREELGPHVSLPNSHCDYKVLPLLVFHGINLIYLKTFTFNIFFMCLHLYEGILCIRDAHRSPEEEVIAMDWSYRQL